MFELTTPAIEANPADEDVELSREQLYQALVWKAQYPTLFVSPILECEIVETFDDGFLRSIRHRMGDGSEWLQERVFLEPNDRVTFLRMSGSVLGRIVNSIEIDDKGRLALVFAFTLSLAGAGHRSAEEEAYKTEFAKGYIAAVHGTLAATREFVRGGVDPTRALQEARAAG